MSGKTCDSSCSRWNRRATTSWMLAKSSTPCDVADLEAAVARLERQPVDELHQAGHRLAAAQVGDVDAFDRARRLGQLEHLLQPGQPLLGIDVKHFGLHVRVQFAALVERFEHVNLVAQPGRLFESQLGGRRLHLGLHLVEQAPSSSLPGTSAGGGCRGGSPPWRSADCTAPCIGRSTPAGTGETSASVRPLSSMSSVAGAELEDLLQHLHRPAQAAGAGKRAVQLDAPRLRLAGELDAGKVLAGGDLKIGERLVVFQVLVVLGLHVLDQPGFDQQGVDFALALQEVDVGESRGPGRPCGVLRRPL